MSILINTTSQPIKRNHICWYVKKDNTNNTITLFEVVDNYYEHPDSKGTAIISKIETERIKTHNLSSPNASPLFQLDIAQNIVTLFKNKEIV